MGGKFYLVPSGEWASRGHNQSLEGGCDSFFYGRFSLTIRTQDTYLAIPWYRNLLKQRRLLYMDSTNNKLQTIAGLNGGVGKDGKDQANSGF